MAERVVIAEDEAIIRLDLKEMLEEEGFQVVAETARADNILELVREHKPDLAILDVKMPGGDGIEIAKEIAAEHLCATLVLTAFSQRMLVEQARDGGAMAYLVKPFQKSQLLPEIELAIGRFEEVRILEEHVHDLEERLKVRKTVDRAKGILMDDMGMKERDAFAWIRKSAMNERVRMDEIARRVLDEGLRPAVN